MIKWVKNLKKWVTYTKCSLNVNSYYCGGYFYSRAAGQLWNNLLALHQVVIMVCSPWKLCLQYLSYSPLVSRTNQNVNYNEGKAYSGLPM